jgi:hypothetical protein
MSSADEAIAAFRSLAGGLMISVRDTDVDERKTTAFINGLVAMAITLKSVEEKLAAIDSQLKQLAVQKPQGS